MLRPTLVAAAATLVMTAAARAEPVVVTSIKPVHSLVSAVMQGMGTPRLLMAGAASPHAYALKPSQAAMLQDADIVFWIGEEMETFLAGPVSTVAVRATSVPLIDADGVRTLLVRNSGSFEDHDHERDDHKHDDHERDDHEHDDHKRDDHKHDDHGHDGHGDHDDHAAGSLDSHVWLDPVNAQAMVRAIAKALSATAAPADAAAYAHNAEAAIDALDALIDEVHGMIAPVKDKRFVVFHDAYQYFERRFGLAAAGSITLSPEVMPGVRRIGEIRARIAETDAVCVFAEPQFEPRLVSVVIDGTAARSGVLDPLGATLPDGPVLYADLIRGMAASLRDCLARAS